ncbi:hypothetical protein ACHWQZ_G006893 [Mnemiopsis leidyi]
MPILYSSVAQNSIVLADHADVVGNFEAATQQILDRTDSSKFSRHTYSVNQYNYHVLTKQGFTFLAIADQDFPMRISFAYLEKVGDKFFSGTLSQRAYNAKPYEFRRDFSPILSSCITQFNKTREVDNMSELQGQVEDVKGVMNQNIEKILQRGENLEQLQQRTSELNLNANRFQSQAVRLRRKMWWQNQKVVISLIAATLIIVTIVTVIVCWQEGVFKKK